MFVCLRLPPRVILASNVRINLRRPGLKPLRAQWPGTRMSHGTLHAAGWDKATLPHLLETVSTQSEGLLVKILATYEKNC